MTVDEGAGSDPPRRPAAEDAAGDSGHLDEDPEALEDPVHSGEAKHQHDLPTRPEPQGQGD